MPYSGQTQALRTVVRPRSDLAGMRVAATNQLSALPEASWPGAKAIFADVESPISLAFLTRYPTPASAAHLGEKRIAAFCASQGYSGKRPAAVLLARLRSAPAVVAALAGCTPVTKEPGKHRAVHFRWACNKRFPKAMTTFADNSRHTRPWAAKIYNDARAAGKDHPHAVRILARAWIRVIWPCWLNHAPYDPARHGAAAALAEPIAA